MATGCSKQRVKLITEENTAGRQHLLYILPHSEEPCPRKDYITAEAAC